LSFMVSLARERSTAFRRCQLIESLFMALSITYAVTQGLLRDVSLCIDRFIRSVP
jgi:hypothetical protein